MCIAPSTLQGMLLSPLLGLPTCREEREQRRADIEHLASSLVNKVNECVAAIDEGEEGSAAIRQCGTANMGSQ